MNTLSSRLATDIPKLMRTLGKDARGYPIPYVVLRGRTGTPHFTVNDSLKVHECIRKRLCPICGKRLGKDLWFVGGPKSAFHPSGAFIDPPTHEECARYALQVCPYLAAPSYGSRIDGRLVDAEEMTGVLLKDLTMIPDRPPMFVLGVTDTYTKRLVTTGHYYLTAGVWQHVEFWRCGQRITPDEAQEHTDINLSTANRVPEQDRPGQRLEEMLRT